ncbi:MAG TPA: hypothetical protein VH917_03780 [Ignavibacteriaceae bacterium]|jgi:hypothetical protein
METPEKKIQINTAKEKEVSENNSPCCGPTCCGNSNNKKNIERKDDQNGNRE